jgi:hypothetical protein
MTIPYSSELVQITASHSGPAPICLLDVLTLDGTSYHWANKIIDTLPVLPPTLPGTPPAWLADQAFQPANYDTHYYPWLLSAVGFHHSRSQQSDTATIQIQDVSGNTLQRDTAGIIVRTSFEGALYCFREWNPLVQQTKFQQNGRLTVLDTTEQQISFGANPCFNPNDYDGNPYDYSDTCQWRYGDRGCGDTSNNPCDNTYVTCRQQGRFFGVLNTVVFPQAPPPANVSTNQVVRNRLV